MSDLFSSVASTSSDMSTVTRKKSSGAISSCPSGLLKTTSLHKISTERKYSEVLVLYSGGTIGMLRTENGAYAPQQHMMERKLRSYPQLHDQEYIDANFSDRDSFLALPHTDEPFRVIYYICEYCPLLDSSNMTMDDWIQIAMDIKKNYEKFNGFVILHGTDTMAYTASALSFMLENLGKSVIITGSQIPLYEARSDGRDNFMNSLIIAGNYCIPEVTILFNNKLFRGNRTSKISISCLDAFNSPNLPPLAKMGIGIQVEWRNLFRQSNIEKFSVHGVLNRNVGLLRLFPSITVEVVRAFLSPPIEGVVLQTYGAGNGPSQRKDLFDEFKRACRRGVIIVNCSQCALGQVDPSYETGSALVDAGVVPGSDMTPEAALTKLSYVLSKNEWTIQTKKKMIESNLRGELTISHKDLKLNDLDIITAIVRTLRLSSSEEIDALRDALYPAILCSIVAEGNLEKLEIMRQFGAYLSTCDYDYRTPLHIAASNGNIKVVEYLLNHGASVHMRDRDHRTPLMSAIDNDHHEVIKLIIKAGGYLNLPSSSVGEMLCRVMSGLLLFGLLPKVFSIKITQYMAQCVFHIVAIIQYASRAVLNSYVELEGQSNAFWFFSNASRQNNIKRLESMFLAGADLNEADSTQRTALHYAVEMNYEESFEYLISHDANLLHQDMYKHSVHDLITILQHDNLLNIMKKHISENDTETLENKDQK